MGKSKWVRRSLATVVSGAAAVTMLWAVSAAQATTVTPQGGAFTATAGTTSFYASNGNGADVTCPQSTASGTVPATGANNDNILANGSVMTKLSSLTFGPAGMCTAAGGSLGADVDTTVGSHEFSLAASGDHLDSNGDSAVAITVPGDSIKIELSSGGSPLCDIDVGHDGAGNPMAESVFGTYSNANDELSVKGQLYFGGTCLALLANPGVFYANGEKSTSVYSVSGNLNIAP